MNGFSDRRECVHGCNGTEETSPIYSNIKRETTQIEIEERGERAYFGWGSLGFCPPGERERERELRREEREEGKREGGRWREEREKEP